MGAVQVLSQEPIIDQRKRPDRRLPIRPFALRSLGLAVAVAQASWSAGEPSPQPFW
jgi:hypothetical protein